MAMHDLAREHVDFDIDGLALAHVGELGLLVVRHHIGALDRHHRHQLRSGLHILADAQRAVADDAVDRRRDRGVTEIEFGLTLLRLGTGQCRIGLHDFGLEQIDLLQRGRQICAVARQRGLCARDPRLRLLRILDAARAARGEIGIALVLLRGEGHRGLVDIEGGFCGDDHRLLDVELGLLAGDRGPGRRHIRLGLVERDPEVAVVDARQHLTGRDALIVLHQHLMQIAGDLRRNGGAVGLHIGVVGRHQILADGPIVPAIPRRARQCGERRACQQQLAQIELFCSERCRRGGSGQQRLNGGGRGHRLIGRERSLVDGHGGSPLGKN